MLVGASATQLLGGASADSVFFAGAGDGATSEQQAAQAIVTAQQREINRIRGYKLQLTPAENQRLSKLQGEILKIQEKVNNGTVRPDELADRVELYEEADRIIGKPVLEIDTENDEAYIGFVSALEALMQRTHDPATQKRIDSLERVKASIETQLADRPDSPALLGRFQTVAKTLSEINPLRRVSELSVQERALYDGIVEKLNAYVGEKVQLSSREAMRVNQLEQSMQQMAANLPADPAGQPTTGSITRALNRLA